MAARGPQNGRQSLERGVPRGLWALNKFIDLSTPSMRKGRDGGEKQEKRKKENIDVFSGH